MKSDIDNQEHNKTEQRSFHYNTTEKIAKQKQKRRVKNSTGPKVKTVFRCMPKEILLPLFLVLIETHSARPVRNDEKQASDDGEELEEIVLDEVAERRVWRQVPEVVDEEIAEEEDEHEDERREFGLEADSDQDDQDETDGEEDDVREVVERENCQKHQHQHHAPRQLHVRARLAATDRRDACKHGLSLITCFGQQKQQATRQREVS